MMLVRRMDVVSLLSNIMVKVDVGSGWLYWYDFNVASLICT